MILNEETIQLYKDFLFNPKGNGFDFPPFKECFEPSEKIIALHELFSLYAEFINKPLPKVAFYIIMKDVYGETQGVTDDDKHNAGYYLKLKF